MYIYVYITKSFKNLVYVSEFLVSPALSLRYTRQKGSSAPFLALYPYLGSNVQWPLVVSLFFLIQYLILSPEVFWPWKDLEAKQAVRSVSSVSETLIPQLLLG